MKLKIHVLVEGAVTLKNDDLRKVVSKKEDVELTNEETKIYADDLNKLQRAGFIRLEVIQGEEKPVEDVQLTPEEIASQKDSIKAKIAELEKEMPTANAARQVEIKNEAKALKKQYKAL